MGRRVRAAFPALLLLAAVIPLRQTSAQEVDFDKIDKFESLVTGTLRVGDPAKTIVDDGQRHFVILTIWDADADTKIYWTSTNGDVRTTVMPGRGVQTFQIAGQFKLQAVGEPSREIKYGYVVLGLKN
jgi:hypothetical protein